MAERIVSAAIVTLEDGSSALAGDSVELDSGDEERLGALGVLAPAEASDEELAPLIALAEARRAGEGRPSPAQQAALEWRASHWSNGSPV